MVGIRYLMIQMSSAYHANDNPLICSREKPMKLLNRVGAYLGIVTRASTVADERKPSSPNPLAYLSPVPGRYQLPEGVSMNVNTPIGWVKLITASGYYRGGLIFVHFPKRHRLTRKKMDAFLAATDGEFLLQPHPGVSNGGNECPGADAVISAGIGSDGWRRYREGSQKGYFKISSAPRLDTVASILQTILTP
jgi:hypothetical protein